MFPCDRDGKRGVLVKSVYRNWKHAKEKCNEHLFGSRGCKSDGGAGYQAHADNRYRAEKFIGCMEENTNIVIQMDSALRKRQENNMVILESIVKTCPWIYFIWSTVLLIYLCYFSGRALDIVRAMDEVTIVADTLRKLRENIDPYSGELFTEAVKLAETIDVQPSVPSLCGRQTKRANTPSSTPEEYYKRSLVIPFLDHLNQQMADRFCELNRKGTMGLHLIPPVETSVKAQTLSFF